MISLFSMFGLFKNKKKVKKEVKILLLGLDNAGKTTILKSLSNENIQTISPTKGFNVKLLEKDSIKFTFWDIGGQQALRHIWENYYENNDAIIYVIDSSDQYRIEETGKEFKDLLEEDKLSGLPLLIFANKQDLNLSLNPDEIIDILNFNFIKDRKWTIVACSALTKMGNITFLTPLGLHDGLSWLIDNVKANC